MWGPVPYSMMGERSRIHVRKCKIFPFIYINQYSWKIYCDIKKKEKENTEMPTLARARGFCVLCFCGICTLREIDAHDTHS